MRALPSVLLISAIDCFVLGQTTGPVPQINSGGIVIHVGVSPAVSPGSLVDITDRIWLPAPCPRPAGLASWLGMQMFGCDLNPVASFVVKNAMEQVDIGEIKDLLAETEAQVRPQIMPHYVCDGSDGEKGKWFRRVGTTTTRSIPLQADFLGSEKPPPHAARDVWEELPQTFDCSATARPFFAQQGAGEPCRNSPPSRSA